jgi:hypothetical protein
MEISGPNIWASYVCNFQKKLPKVNNRPIAKNRPIGKQSPNSKKIAQ